MQMVSDFSYFADAKQIDKGNPQFAGPVILEVETTGQDDGTVQLAINHPSGRYIISADPKSLVSSIMDAISQ